MGVAETIAKNTVFNFFITVFNLAATFIVGVFLARYLGPEQYGLYSFIIWFLTLATLVVNLGIGEMIRRFVAEAIGQNNIQAIKGFVKLSFSIRVLALIVISLLILFLSGNLARLFGRPDDSIYFVLVIGLLVTSVAVGTLDGIFLGYQKYEYSALVALILNVLRTLSIIVLGALGFGVTTILYAYMVTWGIGFIIEIFLVNKILPIREIMKSPGLDTVRRNSAIKYSLAALGILGVDYVLWQNAEIFFLKMYYPVEEVGFYTIAQRIPSMVIALVPFVLGTVLMPAISEQFGKGDMEKIRQIYKTSSRYLMILSFPIAAAGIALARPLITVLFGDEYSSAIILMQIIFIPFAMRGLTHAVSSVIYGIKEPVFLLRMGVVLVCISLGLNLWLIPKYGTMGAVIGTSIPRLIALPLYIRFVSRKIQVPWPLKDTLKITCISIIMGLILFVIQYFLSDILGLVIGICLGIVIYFSSLFIFRLIKTQDLKNLRQVADRLPKKLRSKYLTLIDRLDKFAV
jgi:O-antigen/teichoic acid export membrane protein